MKTSRVLTPLEVNDGHGFLKLVGGFPTWCSFAERGSGSQDGSEVIVMDFDMLTKDRLRILEIAPLPLRSIFICSLRSPQRGRIADASLVYPMRLELRWSKLTAKGQHCADYAR